MKNLNSGDGDEEDDDSVFVPERMDPEEVKRIAKERLKEIKEAAGDKPKEDDGKTEAEDEVQ